MSWYPPPQLGLSATAIAYPGAEPHHPRDPSDLNRCIRYCQAHGISTVELQERMAGRSAEWERLLPEWDNLVALLFEEMTAATDGRAPRTYMEMKRVLAGGTRCTACDGTGRGEVCVRCKGSGRRSGGTCRAPGCYRGAHYCSACHGRGYLLVSGAAL